MPETTPATTPPGAGGQQTPDGIDVQKLADKVYRLLLADARRGGARPTDPSIVARRAED